MMEDQTETLHNQEEEVNPEEKTPDHNPNPDHELFA